MNESRQEQIIYLCQSGDRKAFCELVEEYKSVLFGTACWLTGDSSRAEDAVQTALIKIWEKLPQLRENGNFKAWAVRIVVNEVKQQFRKEYRQTVPLDSRIDMITGTNGMENEISRLEDRLDLNQALNELPPEQKETVVLRYFSELSVPEIAEIMGKPQGTIKSRLNRALEKLAVILNEDDRTGEEV